jgi:DNA mismatch endonuclease, patch repair protein
LLRLLHETTADRSCTSRASPSLRRGQATCRTGLTSTLSFTSVQPVTLFTDARVQRKAAARLVVRPVLHFAGDHDFTRRRRRALRMQATAQRDTPGELALRSAAHRAGLRYRVDWPLPGLRRRADLAFVKARIAVFVDGCFWHGCPTHGTWPKANAAWWRAKIEGNRLRDQDTDGRLIEAGWAVVRLWTHDEPRQAINRIAALVRSRSRR